MVGLPLSRSRQGAPRAETVSQRRRSGISSTADPRRGPRWKSTTAMAKVIGSQSRPRRRQSIETPGCYLILRGPLGSGKSTVAEALAKAVRGKVVHLDGLVDKNWDGGSARMLLRGNVALERRARPLLAKGIPVIFDGCFYWKSQLRDLEARLPFPHETFTLKVPLPVCIDRDHRRSRTPSGPVQAGIVFRKVTRFDWGVSIDGLESVALQVSSIQSRLPKGSLVRLRPRGRSRSVFRAKSLKVNTLPAPRGP
jgi:predicted kinase